MVNMGQEIYKCVVGAVDKSVFSMQEDGQLQEASERC